MPITSMTTAMPTAYRMWRSAPTAGRPRPRARIPTVMACSTCSRAPAPRMVSMSTMRTSWATTAALMATTRVLHLAIPPVVPTPTKRRPGALRMMRSRGSSISISAMVTRTTMALTTSTISMMTTTASWTQTNWRRQSPPRASRTRRCRVLASSRHPQGPATKPRAASPSTRSRILRTQA